MRLLVTSGLRRKRCFLFVLLLLILFPVSETVLGVPRALGEEEATPAPTTSAAPPVTETPGELSWQMPGKVSIYNLQFGPAIFKDDEWQFVGESRTINVSDYKDRLTLMVRFSYQGTRSEIPLKFVIRLPDSRQYEDTVTLVNHQGPYTYHFTIHDPAQFLGSGSVYLYYGFSIIDVLDFTIVSGS